jgi:hypothetical protein
VPESRLASRALIAELQTCPWDGNSKMHLWRLAECADFPAAERPYLAEHLAREVEAAPEEHKRLALRALRSVEEWSDESRVGFEAAWARLFHALPRGEGEEFHFLRLLERAALRPEYCDNLIDAIMGRLPSIFVPAHKELAYEVMDYLEVAQLPEDEKVVYNLIKANDGLLTIRDLERLSGIPWLGGALNDALFGLEEGQGRIRQSSRDLLTCTFFLVKRRRA